MARRKIRVFFASAGDLEEERRAAADALRRMSAESGFEFDYLGYETVLASTGPRPQDLINTLVDQCDVFIAMHHRRWGQPTSDTVASTSYSEEEFERARRRASAEGTPEIFCFFKQVDLPSLADPGEQLAKVLDFRRRLEQSRQVLYRTFANAGQFVAELETHLLAFAEGRLPTPRMAVRRIHIPILADHEPESRRSHDSARVRQALEAAGQGMLEDATVLMASVSQSTRDVETLDLICGFFLEAGNADAAQAVLEKKITLLHDRRLAAREYAAVFMAEPWLDQMVAAMLEHVPDEDRSSTESRVRQLFTGTRFRELMIESMAKYFTVGELLALARFYRGDGATITEKFGHYMGTAVPEINATLARENPELFGE